MYFMFIIRVTPCFGSHTTILKFEKSTGGHLPNKTAEATSPKKKDENTKVDVSTAWVIVLIKTYLCRFFSQ